MPNVHRDSGLKFERGCHHFVALETEWRQFTTGFSSDLNVTAVNGELQLRLARFSELPTKEWSVVVGDWVQNFRAALDHMAWQLSSVQERRNHPTRIEFPIFNDQPRYQQDVPRKIAGVPAAAANIIESLQPFHRGAAFAEHPLWRLHELATIDKHRRLHIGHVSLEAVTINVGSDRLATIWRAAPPAVRAQEGMLLARVAQAEADRFGTSGRLQVQPSAYLTVAFEDSESRPRCGCHAVAARALAIGSPGCAVQEVRSEYQAAWACTRGARDRDDRDAAPVRSP